MADMGIGESMLLGAAIGGGTSLLTGQNVAKGALLGGAFGGIGSGISSAFSPDLAAANPEAYSQGMQALSQAPSATSELAPYGQFLESQPQTTAANLGEYWNTVGQEGNAPIVSDQTAKALAAGAGPAGASNVPAASSGIGSFISNHPYMTAAAVGLPLLVAQGNKQYGINPQLNQPYTGPLSKFQYNPNTYQPDVVNPPRPLYQARYAAGGIAGLNAPTTDFIGKDGMYPQSQQDTTQFSTSPQMPTSMQATMASYEPKTNPITGEPMQMMASGGIAQLNVGGKLLKGGGDGMSDSIKANISGKQEARLADGEFVVPADVVSHLGNGSTDAGAKQLYSMMDKVRQARVGTKKQGKQINPAKYMPA